ncbi:MAG: porin family protein [Bacteroidota bacterium]
MKNKIVFIITLGLLAPLFSFAQLRVGPTLGFNVATFQHSRELKEDINDVGTRVRPTLRLQIGGIAEYAISDELILQSGMIFNGAGVSYRTEFGDDRVNSRFTATYLDIPLTARYRLADIEQFSLSGWGGLIVGFAVGSRQRINVNGERDRDNSRSLDIGSSRSDDLRRGDIRLALGATIESSEYPIQLKIALQQGLANIYPENGVDYAWRNFMFSVSAAYFLDLDL